VILIDINKFANIKKYGNEYKLTLLKCLPSGKCGGFKEKVNDEKMDCNIKRAKAKIFEIAACNEWEWFITGTLDKEKYDRVDIETYIKDLTKFIGNQRVKHKAALKYLLIPELHNDGVSWHFHGLLKGQSEDALRKFTLVEKLPNRIRKLIKSGRVIYDWPDYSDKFGYVTMERVQNKQAISRYITKYLNKDLATSGRYSKQLYYRSRGLEGCQEIKKGLLQIAPDKWDYVNDYIKILWIKAEDVNKYVR
jgi:hypothetical protein